MEAGKILMVVAIAAVALASINLITTINNMREYNILLAPVAQGTADVEIVASASIEFDAAADSLDWGKGGVDTAVATFSVLETESPFITDWIEDPVDGNTVTGGLILGNIGGADVLLELRTSNNADGFIGGTSPGYEWKVNDDPSESGSCSGVLSTTAYSEVSITDTAVCTIFLAEPSTSDQLLIDIRITVPQDAPAGEKSSTIIATATGL